MGWWNSLLRKRAEDWIYAPLEPGQVPAGGKRMIVEANKVYLSVVLQSMRVMDVRKGLSKFYGTVHSFISLPHRSGELARFNLITTPEKLRGVDPTRINNVITIGKRLLGPVPYRGGDLDIEAGLFSIKAVDLTDSYVALLEKAAGLAGVSYISMALPIAGLLLDGVNMLLGAEDTSILEIGLSRTYQTVETGYFAVIRAPKGSVEVNKLRVDSIDYKLIDADNKPINDFPYMVFQISASKNREEWFMIPELKDIHQSLQEDVRRGNYGAVKESLAVFKRVVLTCDDLINDDAQFIYDFVNREVEGVMGPTSTGRGKERTIRDLKDIPLYETKPGL